MGVLIGREAVKLSRAVEWVPVSVAAKVLRCSRQRVHRLIDDGKLSAVAYPGTTLVSMASIAARCSASRLLDVVDAIPREGVSDGK
jgi:hypothetical protein